MDLHLDNLNTNKQKRNQRDQIIAAEIYKMFSTIRDHQSASVKARGEMNMSHPCCRLLRKSGSWSYSSPKRHVIAKVMELPFAEDVNQLTRRVGHIYNTTDPINEHQFNQTVSLASAEPTNERVLVRIDDYLNKQVNELSILTN